MASTDCSASLPSQFPLRPSPFAATEDVSAFDDLVATFVGAIAAAIRSGQELKKHSRDSTSIVAEICRLLGDQELLLGIVAEAQPLSRVQVLPSLPWLQPTLVGVVQTTDSFIQLSSDVEVLWVGDDAAWQLAEVQLLMSDVVAIDTEWRSASHTPSVVQLAIASPSPSCFLIDADAAAPGVLHGLQKVLQSDHLTRIGWSFKQDIKKLAHLCGCDLASFDVIDLQLNCRHLMHVSSQPSLASACNRFLGRPLDKTEQCSDWGRRPLTDKQSSYAALDAFVLLQLLAKLHTLE